MSTADVEDAINLVGIFAFAFSGALMAVRKRMDIVGIVFLASITALGGGIIRDVLIGDSPPAALRNVWWLLLPAAAAVLTFFFHPVIGGRLRRAILAFDAVGLGVFCAEATAKAAAFGLGAVASVLLGAITGIGGGMLRDVLAGEIPTVLRRSTTLYAIPAILGCVIVAGGHAAGEDGVWLQALAAVFVAGIRLLALWRHWGAPAPRNVS